MISKIPSLKADKLLVVRRHNQVIDSPEKGTMKALERKMMLYLMGKAFKTKKYSLSVSLEVFNFSGRMTSGKKQVIHEACQRLASALVIQPVVTDDGKLIGKIEDYSSIKYIPMFNEITLEVSNNLISAEFNIKIVPFLSEFEDNYTSYYFDEIKFLRKSHAIKIFELVQRGFPKYSSKEITVEHFLDSLGYPKKSNYRKGFKEIKRSILDPSCVELSNKTRFKVSWKKGVIHKKTVKTIILHWELKKDLKKEVLKVTDKTTKIYDEAIMKQLNGQTLSNYKKCVDQLLISPKKVVTEKYVTAFNKKVMQQTDIGKFINVDLYQQTQYSRMFLIQYCNK